MSNIPQGAQYIWSPAIKVPQEHYGPVTATRLAYYKFDPEIETWMVYSDVTGWRLSGNTSQWFTTEIAEGYFKEISNGQ